MAWVARMLRKPRRHPAPGWRSFTFDWPTWSSCHGLRHLLGERPTEAKLAVTTWRWHGRQRLRPEQPKAALPSQARRGGFVDDTIAKGKPGKTPIFSRQVGRVARPCTSRRCRGSYRMVGWPGLKEPWVALASAGGRRRHNLFFQLKTRCGKHAVAYGCSAAAQARNASAIFWPKR